MYVKFIVYRLYWPILSSCHYCVANYELDFHRQHGYRDCSFDIKPFMYVFTYLWSSC